MGRRKKNSYYTVSCPLCGKPMASRATRCWDCYQESLIERSKRKILKEKKVRRKKEKAKPAVKNPKIITQTYKCIDCRYETVWHQRPFDAKCMGCGSLNLTIIKKNAVK